MVRVFIPWTAVISGSSVNGLGKGIYIVNGKKDCQVKYETEKFYIAFLCSLVDGWLYGKEIGIT